MKRTLMTCLGLSLPALASDPPAAKPSPDQVLQMLKDSNARYVAGQSKGEHRDPGPVWQLAGSSDQGNYAYCTVLSCSDSRVPAELI